MGEAVLVRRDIEAGARLVRYLISQGFPLTSALWAHISDTDEWRLFIATSAQQKLSRSHAYRLIQGALQRRELGLALSRISLVRDDDPSIQSLQALSDSSKNRSAELRFGSGEIAGQHVDEVYTYRLSPLAFEQQILTALQGMSDLGRVVESSGELQFDSPKEFDFAFIGDRRVVLVEAKSTSRPMGLDYVWEIAQLHPRFIVATSPLAPRFLIVSRSGFTEQAYRYSQPFSPFLRLVKWRGSQDDPSLREALTALLRDGND